MPRQKLTQRSDGYFRVKYHGKEFYGKTQAEAMKARDDYKQKEQMGLSHDLEGITFLEYSLNWLEIYRSDCSIPLQKQYAGMIRFAAEHMRKKFICDITVNDLQAIFNKLKVYSSSYVSKFASLMPKHLIPEMTLDAAQLQQAAKHNDAAVITIGKTSGEFADRFISNDFNLSDAEKQMISNVCTAFHKAGKKVVVILNVCGVVETKSWIDGPDAVLTAWLPGQEGGNSVADILTGKENPSGRLPMTWPASYNDVPCKDDFPTPDSISEDQLTEALRGFRDVRTTGDRKNFDYTEYNDGVYVGYRYYTTKGVSVSYPFGYGLSYTTFKYGKPEVTTDESGNINVKVSVKNSGKVAGKEVVQVYVSAPANDMDKPARELKGFAKTGKLLPGQSETVEINIPYESLASFNETDSQWQVEGGTYRVMVAQNAADAKPLTAEVTEEAKVTETVRPSLEKETK